MNIVEYVVKGGDRWDTIAYKAYGDASLFNGIIDANPSVVVTATLIAGTRLIIPILEDSEIVVDSQLLPPWKR